MDAISGFWENPTKVIARERRERIATAIIGHLVDGLNCEIAAEDALRFTDALIAALDKPKG